MYGEENRLSREEALRLWTSGSSWMSNDQLEKGTIEVGRLADFTALTRDYFTVSDDDLTRIEAELTVVAGKVVHGSGEFRELAPPLPPVLPDWSPVRYYGGDQSSRSKRVMNARCCGHDHNASHSHNASNSHIASAVNVQPEDGSAPWGLGCDCFAF